MLKTKLLFPFGILTVRCCDYGSVCAQGYSMDPADCKVLMDDGVHGNPTHKGVVDAFRYGVLAVYAASVVA